MTKTEKPSKKLVLNTETLRVLNNDQIAQPAADMTTAITCTCPKTNTCTTTAIYCTI